MKPQKKIEKCMRCKKEIDLTKDNYVHMLDYLEGKFFMEGYYHNLCWHENFDVRHNMEKMTKKAFGILRNVLPGKEVYEIR